MLGLERSAVHIDVVGPVSQSDLALLRQQPSNVQNGTAIKRLRQSHHRVARLLASGVRPGEVAARTGYHPTRISILQADPMFQELLAFYCESEDKDFSDFHQSMADLGADAVQELHQRLEESPEDMPSKLLHEIAKDMADRTGHAPMSRSINVNINAGLADRLSAARGRLAELSRPSGDAVGREPLLIEAEESVA